MDAGESSSRLRSSSEVVIANIKLVLDSLVGKNPYRVLGVYGNATSKEVQKNLSRIAAFAKVGRTEEFYTDFKVAFRVSFQRLNAGSEDTHFKLERDEEMVVAAQAQLHSAGDRLLHLCFWWTCATPADEAAFRKLETGDLEGAREIWNRRSNVSAVVNAMTTSWLLADTAMVGAKAEELFCTMGDELCALVDPTLRLEPEALIRRFFVALTEVGCRVETLPQGTHEVWRRLWSEYAAMPYLRAIEKEVAAAASLGDVPAENLQAAKRLKALAVRVLPQLKKIYVDDVLAYQVQADKLAEAVLQRAIVFFNESGGGKAVNQAMPLQQYALSIAEGEQTRQRCRKNVEILQRLLEKMPPKAVLPQVKTLRDEMQRANALGKNAQASLDAAKKMQSLSQRLLPEIRKASVGKATFYKSLADDLALCILQRAIVYYNESDDTYLAYKVMPLQQYALSIAEGAQAKQHCLKNVEILQGIITKLPPEEVANEMKFINSALEKFVKKEENPDELLSRAYALIGGYVRDEEFRKAIVLLDTCKPKLVSVKNKLGNESKWLIEASSTVVRLTLNCIVETINKTQPAWNQIFSPITQNNVLLRREFSSLIRESVRLIEEMDDLVMSSDLQPHYVSQRRVVMNLYRELGLAKPASQPAKPASQPAKPASRPAKPTSQPAKPASRPAKPATLPAKPTSQPAKPASRPAKPATQPAKPTSQPTQAPSRKKKNRVAQATAPVPQSKNGRRWSIVFSVAVCIICSGVFMYFIGKNLFRSYLPPRQDRFLLLCLMESAFWILGTTSYLALNKSFSRFVLQLLGIAFGTILLLALPNFIHLHLFHRSCLIFPFWGSILGFVLGVFTCIVGTKSKFSDILYSLILYIGWGIGVGGFAAGASIFLYFNWDIYLF